MSENTNEQGVNTEAIREWVTALRSGEYKQGEGYLSNAEDGTYCCLGVACELFAERLGLVRGVTVRDAGRNNVNTFNGRWDFLPADVVAFMGLPGENPEVESLDDYDDPTGADVAELNDQGRSFAEIADLIEATYLGEGE